MKTGLFLRGVAASLFLVTAAHSANVGPAGYTNDFSNRPSAADWAAFADTGTANDVYEPDIEVNANIAASAVTAQVTESGDDPPGTGPTPVWSSSGLYLQMRPTQVRYVALLGKFINVTGTNATEVDLSYVLKIAGFGAEETEKGTRVYYSLTGLPESWMNLPALNSTAAAGEQLTVGTNISLSWAHGASLFLLWVDDNSSVQTDVGFQIDNFSLRVTAGAPMPLAAALTAPTSGATFVSGNPITASTTVSFGTPPYTVEYFTNSGAGNTIFASAGFVTNAPYNMAVGTLSPGTYNLYAVVSDSGTPPGLASSGTNTFLVVEPLAVALDSPADEATFTHLTPVAIRATPLGGTPPYIVQFFLNNTAIGEPVGSPPYELNMGALFVGDHTVRARLTDARGWATNSATHTIHISGPLGVISTSTNGAVFTYGQQVALNALPGGGTAPHTVTFYTNGQAGGSISSAPFTLDLGILPPGVYTNYVRVADNAGSEAWSTTNLFFVSANPLLIVLTEPDDGDLVLEGTPFTVTASAFVNAPVTITNVQFFYENTFVAGDTNTPYFFALTNHTAGTRRIYASATDRLGRTTYSTTNRLLVIGSGTPSNDNFNNAAGLTGPATSVASQNFLATKEPGEPNHAAGNPGGGSVWWTWTPSTSGPATIDTIGSDFDTLLGVYTGNALGQLSIVAQNDDASGVQSRVQFSAVAGTVYRVAVDGYSGSRGLIRLNIRGAGGIEMLAPTNGTLSVVGDPVTVTARILPDFPNPPPSRVDFYRGVVLLGSSTSEPFSITTTNTPAGSNTFYVVAFDSQGNSLESQRATVFAQAIGVMILSPFANTVFSTTNPIPISTWTYLPEGSITNVEFFVDGISIGSDSTAPFSLTWSNVVSGTHRLTAVGRSDRGTSHASATVNVRVMATLVPFDAVWRYLDNGSNQGTNWTQPNFDESAWSSGPAPLGFGDSGGRFPATLTAGGRVTYYFRHSFVASNVASLVSLNGQIQRDDGVVVYLNGAEFYRSFNMPSGPISHTDYATFSSDDGDVSWGYSGSASQLVEGTNVLAVEVHQAPTADIDLWLRLNLLGTPIANPPPLVSMIQPTNNQYFLGSSSITLEAVASDLETAVALVEFFVDGVKVGEATNAPYSAVWNSPPVGAHVITARARDDQGSAGMSAAIPIVVYDALGTPLARITSPLDGAIMEGPTNLLVTTTAHGPMGVTNVQFFANGIAFGNDESAPYSAGWSAPFGTNRLTAVTFGADGMTGTSAVITVIITIPPTNVIAPVIIGQVPLASTTLTNLTNLTVTFSEYVQNVDAADLLINGVPATSVDANHSRSNYTFHFPHPAYGPLTVTWSGDHGITDFGWPTVLPFDHQQAGATWDYTLVDLTTPKVAARTPAPGSTVSNLSEISVTFSEEVTGVDADDLRVNGTPALEVIGGGSNYVFKVIEPPIGTIGVTWSTNHGIFDLAATPNPFDRAAFAAAWTFILDNRTVLVQSNSFWRFVKGTNEASIPMDAWRQLAFDHSGWSDSAAPFFFGDPYNSAQNPGTLLSDMANNNYSSLYLRREFTVLNRALITNLWLNAQSDDGFIAWINGVEVRRYNSPTGEVPYNAFAASAAPESAGGGARYINASLSNAVAALVDGRNVLAVQALNQGPFSSDFGFNAQLYTYPVDVTTVGPYLLLPEPPQGDVLYLTNVTITFTEPVSGVDAGDLLVNGMPVAALSTLTNTTYTFTFPQPGFGPVLITWDANHGIVDFDESPRAFDAGASTSTLQYHIINPSSPRVLTQAPISGSSMTGLTAIVVTFTEPVTGVDAADFLVSGLPATSVSGDDGTNYTFSFRQPPYGQVTIGWATNHGIVDAEGGVEFDGIRFGAQWSYTLVDPAPSVAITSPSDGTYLLEPATVTLTAVASDHDGTVVRVQYYEGANLLGESTNAPYTAGWSNILLGTYVLRAVATDNAGLMGTSAPVVLNVVTTLPAVLVRGPYLQLGTPTSGIVRWRSDVGTDGVVYYGTDPENLTNFAAETSVTTDHVVQLTGLEASTRYYYSIGSAAQRLAGTNGIGSEYWFDTAPTVGTRKPTRIWVLGDAGTAGNGAPDRQASTRDAFYNFAASTGAEDIWLMLGDNAYNSGTDSEHQRAVFDMYPATLRNKFLWPTLGNHETSQSTTATDFPYLNIFSLPRNGEAGGVASGTEKYYSFDYANIHFVCLDSMTSGRTGTSPMADWLRSDLAAATAEWIIVFFHHPPYTKGSHDSDSEGDLAAIRQNLVPIMEAYSVDLVLSGHSHCWERSYLIDGHYGFSTGFTDAMKVNDGDGREDGNGAYQKNENGRGVVYTVAGSSGQASGGSLNHPAHFRSLNELGSMVIDVNQNRLEGMFLHANGEILDRFTLIKPVEPPTSPVHLIAIPTGAAEVRLEWIDVATNELGYILERSVDGVVFSQHLIAPAGAVSAVDAGLVQNATYFYRVRATNAVSISDYSNIASVTAATAVSPPEAPRDLVVSASEGSAYYRSQILLRWQDAASNEAAFQIERSVDGLLFAPITTVGANTETYQDAGLESATAYFYRVRALYALGQSGPTTVESDQTHPQSHIVHAGETVSLHAGIEGAPEVTYQWRLMNIALLSRTNETLTLTNADLQHEGNYTVVIEGNNLSFISNPATLVVLTPPRITSEPQDLARSAGMGGAFFVTVHGSEPLSYNWRKDGVSLGVSAPGITFENIVAADQGRYDVIVTNNYGAVTSRLATLSVVTVPSLAQIPDLFAEPLKTLFVTNVAIDLNSPPLSVRYSFADAAPSNAFINPHSGLFYWTPNRAQAPGTNTITIGLADAASGLLSNSMSFTVRVNDYAELSVGTVVLLSGNDGLVSINLFSTVPLGEVQAGFNFAGEYFSDVSFEPPLSSIAAAVFQRVDPNNAALTFTAPSGGSLVGINQLGALRFATRPLTNSTAVPVRITALTGTRGTEETAPTMIASNGGLVIVGSRPLVQAQFNAQGRAVAVYGRTGNYILQFSTNLADTTGWRTRANLRVTNNLTTVIPILGNNPSTNLPIFFRARQ